LQRLRIWTQTTKGLRDAVAKGSKDAAAKQDAAYKEDVETIKKLAAETSAMARQEIAKPEETDPDALKKRLDDLRAIDTYAEYALYATAAQSDAPVMVDLMPRWRSRTQEQISGPGLWAVPGSSRQGRSAAKIPEIAR